MTPTKRSSVLLELLEDLENTDDDGLKTKKTAGDELGAHQNEYSTGSKNHLRSTDLFSVLIMFYFNSFKDGLTII